MCVMVHSEAHCFNQIKALKYNSSLYMKIHFSVIIYSPTRQWKIRWGSVVNKTFLELHSNTVLSQLSKQLKYMWTCFQIMGPSSSYGIIEVGISITEFDRQTDRCVWRADTWQIGRLKAQTPVRKQYLKTCSHTTTTRLKLFSPDNPFSFPFSHIQA